MLPAAGTRQEMSDRLLCAQHGPGEVHVHHAAPLRHGHRRGGGAVDDAGIVDQHVDAAEPRQRSREHRRGGGLVGDIGVERHMSCVPGSFDRGQQGDRLSRGFGRAAMVDEDPRALGREPDGDRPSDAAGRAGHQRDLAVEPRALRRPVAGRAPRCRHSVHPTPAGILPIRPTTLTNSWFPIRLRTLSDGFRGRTSRDCPGGSTMQGSVPDPVCRKPCRMRSIRGRRMGP